MISVKDLDDAKEISKNITLWGRQQARELRQKEYSDEVFDKMSGYEQHDVRVEENMYAKLFSYNCLQAIPFAVKKELPPHLKEILEKYMKDDGKKKKVKKR